MDAANSYSAHHLLSSFIVNQRTVGAFWNIVLSNLYATGNLSNNFFVNRKLIKLGEPFSSSEHAFDHLRAE